MNDAESPKSEVRGPKSRILYLFTRTPLHVGAGASVGAIDQPIIRERPTGFPVIPATSLKGTFADAWNVPGTDGKLQRSPEGEWLFGSTDANNAFAGALQFSEARLLAFPIRSARGSFAWITCPLMLQRAIRDRVLARALLDNLPEPKDETAIFDAGADSKLTLANQVVLEEYTFQHVNWLGLAGLGKELAEVLSDDPIWEAVADRLVILSNGMMSFFAQNACEVAQHVRIDDETGAAAGGALFNQENVPSETMFYAVLHAFRGRGDAFKDKTPDQAIRAFQGQDNDGNDQADLPGVRKGAVLQFGGDASTGLGYCTVKLSA
ncbi:MAG: type III-B CRISPR module RAMP protein Cmr4 [Verrucomicrobiales bacterium]|nr:type III-B CRISPR module RAMP protein Cmr4 [Verrucomicrobiales bacterium]